MAAAKKNWMTQADRLFSQQIRERDGRCMAQGTDRIECKGVLQCAHIHSRSYKSIRTDFDNALALCQAHHTYYTHRPLEWHDWVEAQYPGRWWRLKTQALRYERIDWKQRLQELKGENMSDRTKECDNCDEVIPYPRPLCPDCEAELK